MKRTITTRSDFDVEVVEIAGSDKLICKAAKVSTLGGASINEKESAGLIRFLMTNRHGSPFEHGMLMFRISAPIVVWREFMRHRIGMSYNEQSARYMELEPVFYIPSTDRNLIESGPPGRRIFTPASSNQYETMRHNKLIAYQVSWDSYVNEINCGIAKEVARFDLNVGIYSTAYVTMNPRSLMHFLSLRTHRSNAQHLSFPQWEINEVANQIEDLFAKSFPTTWEAFNSSGRVGP